MIDRHATIAEVLTKQVHVMIKHVQPNVGADEASGSNTQRRLLVLQPHSDRCAADAQFSVDRCYRQPSASQIKGLQAKGAIVHPACLRVLYDCFVPPVGFEPTLDGV